MPVPHSLACSVSQNLTVNICSQPRKNVTKLQLQHKLTLSDGLDLYSPLASQENRWFHCSLPSVSTFRFALSVLVGLLQCVHGEHFLTVRFRKTEIENPVSPQNCIQLWSVLPHSLLEQKHKLCEDEEMKEN